jgi:hypothetical protein
MYTYACSVAWMQFSNVVYMPLSRKVCQMTAKQSLAINQPELSVLHFSIAWIQKTLRLHHQYRVLHVLRAWIIGNDLWYAYVTMSSVSSYNLWYIYVTYVFCVQLQSMIHLRDYVFCVQLRSMIHLCDYVLCVQLQSVAQFGELQSETNNPPFPGDQNICLASTF